MCSIHTHCYTYIHAYNIHATHIYIAYTCMHTTYRHTAYTCIQHTYTYIECKQLSGGIFSSPHPCSCRQKSLGVAAKLVSTMGAAHHFSIYFSPAQAQFQLLLLYSWHPIFTGSYRQGAACVTQKNNMMHTVLSLHLQNRNSRDIPIQIMTYQLKQNSCIKGSYLASSPEWVLPMLNYHFWMFPITLHFFTF